MGWGVSRKHRPATEISRWRIKTSRIPTKKGLQEDPKQRSLHCPGTRKLQRERGCEKEAGSRGSSGS